MLLPAYVNRIRDPLHPRVRSNFMWMFLDRMHVVGCKGVASWVYGALLCILIKDRRLGRNQGLRMKRINTLMKRWYTDHGRPGESRLPTLRLQDVLKDGVAELHGQAMKAAATRHAAPFFHALALEYFTSDTLRNQLVQEVTGKLVQFYEIETENEIFFSKAAHRRYSAACVAFGTAYQRLRALAEANDEEELWPLKPKLHKMQHLPFFRRLAQPEILDLLRR